MDGFVIESLPAPGSPFHLAIPVHNMAEGKADLQVSTNFLFLPIFFFITYTQRDRLMHCYCYRLYFGSDRFFWYRI